MYTDHVIGRLSTYRRILLDHQRAGKNRVFSHELAALGGFTPAQVRRDIMTIGYNGSPARGYEVAGLITRIGQVLDCPGGCAFALVGVGHLGQAVLAYFDGRNPYLRIGVAFDVDPRYVGKTIHGCPCHPIDELERIIKQDGIRMAVLAVPARAAQAVTDRLIAAGVNAILNFVPTRLNVPDGVYVEHVDITVSLERVAFRSRVNAAERERSQPQPAEEVHVSIGHA